MALGGANSIKSSTNISSNIFLEITKVYISFLKISNKNALRLLNVIGSFRVLNKYCTLWKLPNNKQWLLIVRVSRLYFNA